MNPSLSVRPREPLAKHTAWRTGGPCDAFVVAHDEAGVAQVLDECRAEGWKVLPIGAGTRSVAREGGVDGVVLRLGTGFLDLRFEDPDLLIAGGAWPVPALLSAAAARGLVAAQPLYAVPGSFGASVLHDDWQVVGARLARPGRVGQVEAARLGARTKGIVLEAGVRLEPLGADEAERRLRRALRGDPLPPSSWVGGRRVRSELRRASLERVRLRDVAIPEEAPELMVNLGGGTAQDMQLLHQVTLDRVKRTRGVALESRIRWFGERSET